VARLIDTSVFVEIERRGAPVEAIQALVGDQPLAMAGITAAELLAGLYRAESDHRRATREVYLDRVFRSMPVVPFDLATPRVHADIWSRLSRSGSLIGSHDLIIAATAVRRGDAVVTFNARDFSRVTGLQVETPRL
jgi:tRNA(fMet)-specific endonuclease VapC